jgi:hypothetical protein
VIERIVAPLGLRFDGPSTEANARLPDGIGCTRSSRPFRSDGIRDGLAGATPRPPRRGRGTTARAERKPDRIGGG